MKNNHHLPAQERWDLLDHNRVPTGKTLCRGEKIPAGIYHIVVLGWIVNSSGEFLISRRSPQKSNPLLWETTGGAKQAGEDSLKAVIREIKEEVGIDVSRNRPVFLGTRQRLERIYFDCWMFFKDFPIEAVRFSIYITTVWPISPSVSKMIPSSASQLEGRFISPL